MHLTARLAPALALILLAACQMQVGGKPAPSDLGPLATDAIAVTPLDGASASMTPLPSADATGQANATPPVQIADKDTPRPQPRPDATPAPVIAAEPAPPPSTPPISPEAARCAKSGGEWAVMGKTSGHLCVHRTRDAGKFCNKKSQCQGECLAQSHTCSPITPLTGCNDILQADGSRMTLCLQ